MGRMGSPTFMAAAAAAAAMLVVLAEAKKGRPWTGPDGDNPKPFVLRYQKYIGPFMAM